MAVYSDPGVGSHQSSVVHGWTWIVGCRRHHQKYWICATISGLWPWIRPMAQSFPPDPSVLPFSVITPFTYLPSAFCYLWYGSLQVDKSVVVSSDNHGPRAWLTWKNEMDEKAMLVKLIWREGQCFSISLTFENATHHLVWIGQKDAPLPQHRPITFHSSWRLSCALQSLHQTLRGNG